MKNLEKVQIEPEYGRETEIDLDEIAKKYAEEVRNSLIEQKEKKTDIHLSKINPEELTYDDLIIYDKFAKGALEESELKEYRDRMHEYFEKRKEEENKKGADFNFLNIANDSRSNFEAMIWNQFQGKKFDEKLAQRGISV